MLWRICWHAERAIGFSWRLRVWIADDCPYVAWRWLCFWGSVWLLPHDQPSIVVLGVRPLTASEAEAVRESQFDAESQGLGS